MKKKFFLNGYRGNLVLPIYTFLIPVFVLKNIYKKIK